MMIEVIASGVAGIVFLVAAAYASVVDAILDKRQAEQDEKKAAQKSGDIVDSLAAYPLAPAPELTDQVDRIVDEGQQA
jgi:hypothetical protein